jgi:ribonuclease HI
MLIQIYTDGSCLGNPGPGGWANIVRYSHHEEKGQGGEVHTTNNRMEMQAVIEALKEVASTLVEEHGFSDKAGSKAPEAVEIKIYTDSSLIVNTMTKNWKKKKNTDLWKDLDLIIKAEPLSKTKISWNWVKGHAGHVENEDCDRRANVESAAFAKHARLIPNSEKRLPGETPSLF